MGGDVGFEKWIIKDRWASRTCPRKQITRTSRDWLQLFSTYKAGHLLYAGGVFDQPAIYINAMTVIESLIAEARSK